MIYVLPVLEAQVLVLVFVLVLLHEVSFKLLNIGPIFIQINDSWLCLNLIIFLKAKLLSIDSCHYCSVCIIFVP